MILRLVLELAMKRAEVHDELPGEKGDFTFGNPDVSVPQLKADLLIVARPQEQVFTDKHNHIVAEVAVRRYQGPQLA
jgi:hypothetical protein